LNNLFGITSINGLLAKRGEERIFLFQGNFSEEQIKKLESNVIIERLGIYFAKEVDNELKLSIEGTQLLKNQIKKNIVEINEKEAEQWMMGQTLFKNVKEKRFVIIKYKDDLLGCGKASQDKITNFIPKSRRLKSKERN